MTLMKNMRQKQRYATTAWFYSRNVFEVSLEVLLGMVEVLEAEDWVNNETRYCRSCSQKKRHSRSNRPTILLVLHSRCCEAAREGLLKRVLNLLHRGWTSRSIPETTLARWALKIPISSCRPFGGYSCPSKLLKRCQTKQHYPYFENPWPDPRFFAKTKTWILLRVSTLSHSSLSPPYTPITIPCSQIVTSFEAIFKLHIPVFKAISKRFYGSKYAATAHQYAEGAHSTTVAWGNNCQCC